MDAPVTRAILWDLDGVIVDSGLYHYEAYRRVFGELRRSISGDEFFSGLIGLRNDAIIRKVLGEVPDDEVKRIADRKETAFRELVSGNVDALPGVRYLVEDAKAAGLKQAIVSSTPRANIDLILGELKFEGFFTAIVGEEDAAKGKPDPEGFLVAMSRLGMQANECVVIEDAPEGITAGKAAGARTIGVATTRPAQRLTEADLVVGSLDDRKVWMFIRGEPL
jgi:HAD superfamily hydrolase (TIGR01509 family)